ncbi:MAG: hypothetical protein M3R21_00420 [Candidatus Dormibacteraeota bacterium]|nr:hypothetical protein [Candidatus Dormibacteraeota bacterium]
MTGPWTRDVASASGQVFEFRLWAALVEQSLGQLHVFLPLADRGIDALVHRLSDGTYFRVQAKGRSSLIGGEVRLVVWAVGLVDDDALLVSGLIVEGGLGPTMLAVPVRDFKRLAEKTSVNGEVVYSMSFGMRPRSDTRWLPYLHPTERLVEKFGHPTAAIPIVEEVLVEPRPSWRSDLGFRGESEVVRQLADSMELNLFRPFPDLETSELVALHLQTRRIVGLQIKTVGIDSAHPTGAVMVHAASFRPSPTTYFVVLAWHREEDRFHDECLLIPSEQLRSITQPKESSGHLKFEWRPGARSQRRLNTYRRELSHLGSDVEAILL